jgi:mannose-6-phosphate isomerase-like protein (cupin superfamily)
MQRLRFSAQGVALALVIAAFLYFGLGVLLHYVVFPEAEPPAWAYPKSGFTFETPTGEKFRVIRSAVDTNGELAQAHFDLIPGGHAPRAHVHPHQEERFQIIAGTLTVMVKGEEKVVSAGETIVVPPGTPHQPFNRSNVEMRSLAEIRPAGKLGLFFGQMAGLDFKPSFLQMMLFVRQYDIYPATPPPAVLRVVSFILAPTARLVGYRSFYAEHAKRFLRSAAEEGPAAEATQRAPLGR